jgi:hypothetical protein
MLSMAAVVAMRRVLARHGEGFSLGGGRRAVGEGGERLRGDQPTQQRGSWRWRREGGVPRHELIETKSLDVQTCGDLGRSTTKLGEDGCRVRPRVSNWPAKSW